MRMKRQFVWVFAAILTLSGLTTMLTSCSEEDNPASEGTTRRLYSTEVYKFLNKANERESIDMEAAKEYEPTIWRSEEKNKKEKLPNNFRSCKGELDKNPINDHQLPDTNYVPSRKGLDDLCISGSARFSQKQLVVLTNEVNQLANGRTKVMIDLRAECHGLVNGIHMSWYGKNNWSNIGRSRDEIIAAEEQLFNDIKGTTITTAKISSDYLYVPRDTSYVKVKADSTFTEKQAVEALGWQYRRVTALDHAFPSDAVIDQFLDVYRSLPENAWVHFHCHKGNGRTTTFMSFFDMLRNPDVPLKDILYRQAKLGGGNLYYSGDSPDEISWRIPLYAETTNLIPLLYDYVQDNKSNGYQVSWTAWKKATVEAGH